MAAHLIEISAAVDPGAHAVLIVDQAGWHLTPKLAIPDNITVLALPPRSPELNPVRMSGNHARQLVVEPDLQILRRHRRAVLPSLEQPHRPTMEDHVPRHAQMGAWVLINDRWYYQPGNDGVVAADLPGHEPLQLDAEDVSLDLRIPLSRYYDIPADLLTVIGDAEIDPGRVTVKGGVAYLGDHRLESQAANAIAKACAEQR